MSFIENGLQLKVKDLFYCSGSINETKWDKFRGCLERRRRLDSFKCPYSLKIVE